MRPLHCSLVGGCCKGNKLLLLKYIITWTRNSSFPEKDSDILGCSGQADASSHHMNPCFQYIHSFSYIYKIANNNSTWFKVQAPANKKLSCAINNRACLLCSHLRVASSSYLSLLVDDGHCVLQLDVIEQAGQEDVGHADQTVVLLLIKEWVGTLEIGAHHLQRESDHVTFKRLQKWLKVASKLMEEEESLLFQYFIHCF